uniref:Uncharacterized protein n=1 Tax=Poecilia mexicana TaxID=48701 RepID=A0A3B3WRJ9_9TELE
LANSLNLLICFYCIAPLYEWEYYLDYLDPVFVDESQLKYHKYSIVIILWVSLAAFVGFLFLILNLMSLSMAPMAVWILVDLNPFCLLRWALVTKVTWDRNRSAEDDPLHSSWMYKDNKNSPGSAKKKKVCKTPAHYKRVALCV